MPSLSVVMIVKDEADCLADCLGSVRAIADEIVIGDTGSTDVSVAIAEGFEARVIDVEWRDDFAAARNAVLDAATGDWLLHLDADEVVDPETSQRIRACVDADGDGADAIELTLANYCNAPRAWRWTPVDPQSPHARGHAGYIAAPLLRLFRNGRCYRYREAVHENITESVREDGGVIHTEPWLIHHYGYAEPDPAKGLRYLGMAKRKAEAEPANAKAWHDLAEQHFALGEDDEAESACERAIAIDATHLGAVTTLANLYMMRGDLDEAHELLSRVDGVAPHVSMALGAIAIRQGDLLEADRQLALALEAQPINIMAMPGDCAFARPSRGTGLRAGHPSWCTGNRVRCFRGRRSDRSPAAAGERPGRTVQRCEGNGPGVSCGGIEEGCGRPDRTSSPGGGYRRTGRHATRTTVTRACVRAGPLAAASALVAFPLPVRQYAATGRASPFGRSRVHATSASRW